jgi:4-diphosphocytidyl-2C-methyl-D-erythritol kinase
MPPVGPTPSKTARRFGALSRRDFTDGHRSWRLSQRIARGAPPPTNDLVNVFEAVIERTDAELVAHYASYRGAGAPQLHLCGAGPAVFFFVREGARAADLRRNLEAVGAQVFEARTLPRAQALAIERES